MGVKKRGSGPVNLSELQAQFMRAVGEYQAGHSFKASKILAAILKAKPDIPEVLHLSGVIAVESGKFTQACRLFRNALKAAPDSPDLLNALGIALMKDGRPEDSLAPLEKAAQSKPDNPVYSFDLGNALNECGRLEQAAAAYRDAIGLAPDWPDPLFNLGDLLLKTGEPENALEPFQRAAELTPDSTDVFEKLAVTYYRLDRQGDSVAASSRALELSPGSLLHLRNLGMAFYAYGRYRDCVRTVQQALEQDPSQADMHGVIGLALHQLNRAEDSLLHLKKAVELDPESAEASFNLGTAYITNGDTEHARTERRRTLELDPGYTEAYLSLTYLNEYDHLDHPDVAGMRVLLEDEALADDKKIELHFALSRLHEHLDDPDNSFRHLVLGNRLAARAKPFDAPSLTAEFDDLIETFGPTLLSAPGRAVEEENHSTRPIFVLGMPRSGTTMIEQVLSGHSMVFGAGELPVLNILTQERCRPYPRAVSHFKEDDFRRFGEAYLDEISEFGRPDQKVVDKMPHNFMHIGLIAKALPNAVIVHCRRDPVDTCFSCYQQIFASNISFNYDLTDLGVYYREYRRLMDHWQDLLGERIIEVRYEDFVADPETQARLLIERCGLEWEDACLDLSSGRRTIRTASLMQARKPVYQSSVKKWKRFEKQLRPLLDALGDLAGE